MKAKLTLEDGRTIDIELTTEQAKAMEVKKVGRWKPKNLETYYYNNWAEVDSNEWTNDKVEIWLFETWEIYKTEEEAQFTRDRKVFITKVNDRIDELNDGWIADWMEEGQKKYYMYSYLWVLSFSNTDTVRADRIIHYIKSREVAGQIIEEFKDELLKYIFN